MSDGENDGGLDTNAIDITKGPLLKPLLLLAGPIIASMFLQVAYNIADTFWVGQLGAPAVTAITYAYALVMIIIGLASGVGIAGTVLVAQNKGAGDLDAVNHSAGQTILFATALSLVLSVIGYVFAPTILRWLGAVPGTPSFDYGVSYTRIIFLGLVFTFGFFVFQSLLRGWGNTKVPFYFVAASVTLNVVLDPLLIFGFVDNPLFAYLDLTSVESVLAGATGFGGFGVEGAAIATIIARGGVAVTGLAYLVAGTPGPTVSLGDFVPDPKMLKTIVDIGAPSGAEQLVDALALSIILAILGAAGTDAVAGYGIGLRVNALAILPAMGLAQAVETSMGQNLGQGNSDRARRTVFHGIGIVMLCVGALSLFVYGFAEQIIETFVSGPRTEQVVESGAAYLKIVGLTYPIYCAIEVVQGGFRGSGNTRTALGFSLVLLWVFRVPGAYVMLTFTDLGATGVWYAIAFSNVATLVLAIGWFLRGTWTSTVVEGVAKPEQSKG